MGRTKAYITPGIRVWRRLTAMINECTPVYGNVGMIYSSCLRNFAQSLYSCYFASSRVGGKCFWVWVRQMPTTVLSPCDWSSCVAECAVEYNVDCILSYYNHLIYPDLTVQRCRTFVAGMVWKHWMQEEDSPVRKWCRLQPYASSWMNDARMLHW